MLTKTFNLTPAQFEYLRSELAEDGVSLSPGNQGTFFPPTHPEIELRYDYDGVAILTMTILKSAWYESAGAVWSGLSAYLPAQ